MQSVVTQNPLSVTLRGGLTAIALSLCLTSGVAHADPQTPQGSSLGQITLSNQTLTTQLETDPSVPNSIQTLSTQLETDHPITPSGPMPPVIQGVPEPGTLTAGLALVSLGFLLRTRRRR